MVKRVWYGGSGPEAGVGVEAGRVAGAGPGQARGLSAIYRRG